MKEYEEKEKNRDRITQALKEKFDQTDCEVKAADTKVRNANLQLWAFEESKLGGDFKKVESTKRKIEE